MKRILTPLVLILVLSFTGINFKQKKENMVYIPSGNLYLNNDTVSINTMYMSSTEVTNKEYRTFLIDLKLNNRIVDFEIANVDSINWKHEGYKFHYFNHSEYQDYPVVNVTKEGAKLYGVWYTKLMRKKYPEVQFKEFRLPTKQEWIYVAKGAYRNSPYPWGGPFARDSKGNLLANFSFVGSLNIRRGVDGEFLIVDKEDLKYLELDNNPASDILAPSKSYNVNGFGLYNMVGNVNELVSDEDVVMGGDWQSASYDIRVTSEKEYKTSSPIIGFRLISSYPLTKVTVN